MARLRFAITTEGEVALVAATAKTLLQIAAPANQRVAVRGFSISFDGVSGSAEPVKVDILRQTTAGTMTAATEVSEDGLGSETIQSVGQHTATAEPTPGAILRSYNVHPQTGAEWKLSIDEEFIVPGGGRIGLRATAPANVNALAHLALEE